MALRKNVKRIDPRYFLNETANRLEERDGESAEEVAMRFKSMPIPMLVQAAVQDMRNMADGSMEMASHYPHVQDLAAFAQEVL
ncbi:MAG TPA: hypothetical protein EYN67_13500, partial [Flavobacteriales bacterium]|nr:hypothetical protein [Flavobacteriales bacterium]